MPTNPSMRYIYTRVQVNKLASVTARPPLDRDHRINPMAALRRSHQHQDTPSQRGQFDLPAPSFLPCPIDPTQIDVHQCQAHGMPPRTSASPSPPSGCHATSGPDSTQCQHIDPSAIPGAKPTASHGSRRPPALYSVHTPYISVNARQETRLESPNIRARLVLSFTPEAAHHRHWLRHATPVQTESLSEH